MPTATIRRGRLQRAAAHLCSGLACGLLLPVLGKVVAGRAGRRADGWLVAAALGLTLAVLLGCLAVR